MSETYVIPVSEIIGNVTTTVPDSDVLWQGQTYPNRKFLVIIPARGGSKKLPGKNIAKLNSQELISWTILDAMNAKYPGDRRIVVSTDDDKIAIVSKQYGAEVIMRPKELSGDRAPSEWAVRHVLDSMDYKPDYVIMLQCTSPIRSSKDIEGAIREIISHGADSLLSVVPANQFIWRGTSGNCYPLNYDKDARPMRQYRPAEWFENGSIYIFRPWVLDKLANRLGGSIALYEMSPWSRFEVDSQEDLEFCEWIMKHGQV